MSGTCPSCGKAYHTGARFCGRCGADLVAIAPSDPQINVSGLATDAASKAKDAVVRAGTVAGPAATRAGAVVAPVAKDAAAKGWQSSKAGMGIFSKIMTLGGRAAYAELFRPQPVVHGVVANMPQVTNTNTPFEWAVLLFLLGFVAAGLVLGLPDPLRILIIVGILILLLVLSWLGVRRPYFSRLTFVGLWGRLRHRGKAPVAQRYQFHIHDTAQAQPITVYMLGERRGRALSQGASVEVWGIFEAKQTRLRAWRVLTTDPTGKAPEVLTCPKPIPLTVALFLPAFIMLFVWLLDIVL